MDELNGYFFFFKQKTAYEMRISDWSSDVCSSDLKAIHHYPRDHYAFWDDALGGHALLASPGAFGENISTSGLVEDAACIGDRYRQIGRAACRARACQYV